MIKYEINDNRTTHIRFFHFGRLLTVFSNMHILVFTEVSKSKHDFAQSCPHMLKSYRQKNFSVLSNIGLRPLAQIKWQSHNINLVSLQSGDVHKKSKIRNMLTHTHTKKGKKKSSKKDFKKWSWTGLKTNWNNT